MATTFMESGTSATQGTEFWTVVGTATSDTVHYPFSGPRSIKLFTSSPAVTATAARAAVLADAGRRISFRFRFDTLPAGTAPILRISQSSIGTVVFALNLLTTGALNVVPTGIAATAGTTILKTNTWYRIGVAYTVTNSTTYTINVFIDGKLEITKSGGGTMSNVTSAALVLIANSALGVNVSEWYQDIYVDDSTALTDPGNIIVTNKRPVSAGAANNWTTQIGSGGSGYGTGHSPQVNEQPLSTTNGWSIASSSLIVEDYTIEGASVGDVDVSNPRYQLVDFMGWVYFKSGTADTRNIIVAGAASNITTTTAFALYLKIAGSTTYPSTNAAIGMNNNSLVALASLAECGILLAYKLPRRVSSCVG